MAAPQTQAPEGACGFPPVVTPMRPPAVQFILIGAGGTGKRLLAPMIKMLRGGDRIDVIDHDHVEARNLSRQHFLAKHVGQNKAEIAASALRAEAARLHVTINAWPDKATDQTLKGLVDDGRAFQARVILGCVDNREARVAMHNALAFRAPSAWIDAGNESTGGQVMMTLRQWPCWKLEQRGQPWKETKRNVLRAHWAPEMYLSCDTLKTVVPALLKPAEKTPAQVAADDCDARLDTQTVAVNQMAAAVMINMLGWLLDEVPFSNPGAFFSTQCSMKPVPFKELVAGMDGGMYHATV